MKLRYRPRGLRPRTPCGGRAIVFKWPGRPHPEKNPGDATDLSKIIGIYEIKYERKHQNEFKTNENIREFNGTVLSLEWMKGSLVGFEIIFGHVSIMPRVRNPDLSITYLFMYLSSVRIVLALAVQGRSSCWIDCYNSCRKVIGRSMCSKGCWN